MAEYKKNPQANERRVSLPDNDTFEYLFKKSKFGVLRAAQFIFTLVSWILVAHFKNNAKDTDHDVIAFALFAYVAAWLYSVFALVLSLLVMARRLDDLIRTITLVCCCLTCSVFCIIASSLLADYVNRLAGNPSFCTSTTNASCEQLRIAAVFGYLSVVCFIIDAGYQIYILNQIKESAAAESEIYKNSSTTRVKERNVITT